MVAAVVPAEVSAERDDAKVAYSTGEIKRPPGLTCCNDWEGLVVLEEKEEKEEKEAVVVVCQVEPVGAAAATAPQAARRQRV